MTIIKTGSSIPPIGDGLVIAKRNGNYHYRRAPQRKVKDSWTPQQVLHRQRFSLVNKFCGLFKHSLIPQIWNYEAVIMSGYSLFLKTNMPAFAADGSIADVKKIMLSTGKLPFPSDLTALPLESEPGILEVSWHKEPFLKGERQSDELMIISVADGHYSEITATNVKRWDLKGSFQLPPVPLAATHFYLLFASKDRRDYSPSVCFLLEKV